MMLIYKDEEIVLNFVLQVNGTMKKEKKKEKVSRYWIKWIKHTHTHTLTNIKNSSTGLENSSIGWKKFLNRLSKFSTGCHWLKISSTSWENSSTSWANSSTSSLHSLTGYHWLKNSSIGWETSSTDWLHSSTDCHWLKNSSPGCYNSSTGLHYLHKSYL